MSKPNPKTKAEKPQTHTGIDQWIAKSSKPVYHMSDLEKAMWERIQDGNL